MISVDGLTVEFGGTTLFSDISFQINEKDRIALMGKNGAGKSTLLKILAGVRQPTRGKVTAPKDCVIAYLPQHLMTEDGRTVFEEASQAFAHLREMEEELIVNLKKSEFLVAMATDPEDPTKVNIPYLKNKQGDILQPAFTDVMEFEKFARGKKLRAAKVPFAKLPGLIINQAKAFVINPMGFNLILDRVQLGKILGVEIPPASVPAESAPAAAATQETKASEGEVKAEEAPAAETPVQ